VGSNPTLSATLIADFQLPISNCDPEKFENWKFGIGNTWRGAGVVELAALEML
jgi:hypothetical protein